MTAYERGDVVEVSDPFDPDHATRPYVIVSTDAHPFHGEQYVAVTLTTRTWYEDRIPIDEEDFIDGGVPEQSSIVPWGISSPGHEDISDWFGRLRPGTVDRTVDALTQFLTE